MLEHDAFQPLTCRENGTAFLTVGQKQANDIFEIANQFIHPAAGEDRVSQSSALDHCISPIPCRPASEGHHAVCRPRSPATPRPPKPQSGCSRWTCIQSTERNLDRDRQRRQSDCRLSALAIFKRMFAQEGKRGLGTESCLTRGCVPTAPAFHFTAYVRPFGLAADVAT